MRILALDQASLKTGAAFFEDTTLKGSTVLDYSKVKNAKLRNEKMVTEILEVIKELRPEVIVIEDVALQRNAAVLIMLARIQGAIIGYCFENQVTNVIYKPSEWRKMLDFKQGSKMKRADLKKQAIQFVKEHYDLDASEDEADAICIGCAFACAQEAIKAVVDDGE